MDWFNDHDIDPKKSSKLKMQRNLNTPIKKNLKGEDTRKWLRVEVKVKYFFTSH